MNPVIQDLLLTFTDPALLFGHFTYLLLIISMLMRRIVWLRSVAIVAGIAKIIYRTAFVFDPVSILWETIFVLVNIGELLFIWWQNRPVRLRDEEQRLIATVAPRLSRVATNALLATAQWRDVPPGTILTTQGAPIGGLIYVSTGEIDVVVDGHTVGAVGSRELLGEITWADGALATATATARTMVRYVWFDRKELSAALGKLEVLHFALQASISRDLVRKLVRTTQRAAVGTPVEMPAD
jgi:Cyclic nucleotide-binding domain